jgi:hypothetical protein
VFPWQISRRLKLRKLGKLLSLLEIKPKTKKIKLKEAQM